MYTVSLLLLSLAVCTQAFLFPSAGGGGCGGGCGGGGSECMPKIACTKMCFSIPMLKMPPPPSPCGCGCGGRKKRSALAIEGATETCSDPKLRKVIIDQMQDDVSESRSNIVTALAKEFANDRFMVMCTTGSEQKFSHTSDYFCVDGSPKQTCYVFSTGHTENADDVKKDEVKEEKVAEDKEISKNEEKTEVKREEAKAEDAPVPAPVEVKEEEKVVEKKAVAEGTAETAAAEPVAEVAKEETKA